MLQIGTSQSRRNITIIPKRNKKMQLVSIPQSVIKKNVNGDINNREVVQRGRKQNYQTTMDVRYPYNSLFIACVLLILYVAFFVAMKNIGKEVLGKLGQLKLDFYLSPLVWESDYAEDLSKDSGTTVSECIPVLKYTIGISRPISAINYVINEGILAYLYHECRMVLGFPPLCNDVYLVALNRLLRYHQFKVEWVHHEFLTEWYGYEYWLCK